jgi:1-deoxyxylulose-5-phosphate synthase
MYDVICIGGNMHRPTRRDFLKSTVAATVLAGVPARAAKRSATDVVTLGKSGIKVTRLALGTGTKGGSVQRALGQEEFTKIVRHAYDRGIRFFETADAYTGMPQMLATALKGIPRDSYKLMTKYRLRLTDDPKEVVDRFRKDLNSDYFDILLMHCVRQATWPQDTQRVQDAFSDFKAKKVILSHGASVHGLIGLRQFPGNKWLDVALLRINHKGVKMDTLEMRDSNDIGNVDEVTAHAKKIHGQGTGVLGMKLVGEGQFTTPEDREKSLQYVLGTRAVDAFTMGFKSTAEVDEAIERINRVLNA